jgi:hypothetical protein
VIFAGHFREQKGHQICLFKSAVHCSPSCSLGSKWNRPLAGRCHAIQTSINHAFDMLHACRPRSPQERVYVLYIGTQYSAPFDIVRFACERLYSSMKSSIRGINSLTHATMNRFWKYVLVKETFCIMPNTLASSSTVSLDIMIDLQLAKNSVHICVCVCVCVWIGGVNWPLLFIAVLEKFLQ